MITASSGQVSSQKGKRTVWFWNASGRDVPPYGILWQRHPWRKIQSAATSVAYDVEDTYVDGRNPGWSNTPMPASVAKWSELSWIGPNGPGNFISLGLAPDGSPVFPCVSPWTVDAGDEGAYDNTRYHWPEVRNMWFSWPGCFVVNGPSWVKKDTLGIGTYMEFPERVRYEGGVLSFRQVSIGDLVSPCPTTFGAYPNICGCWTVIGKEQEADDKFVWVSPVGAESLPLQAVIYGTTAAMMYGGDLMTFPLDVDDQDDCRPEQSAAFEKVELRNGHGIKALREGSCLIGINAVVRYGGAGYSAPSNVPCSLHLQKKRGDVYRTINMIAAGGGSFSIITPGKRSAVGFMPERDYYDSDGNGTMDASRTFPDEQQIATFSGIFSADIAAEDVVVVLVDGHHLSQWEFIERSLWVSQEFPVRRTFANNWYYHMVFGAIESFP